MNDKQEQKVGNHSTVMQAKGCITVNNNGLGFTEVKELCLLLLRDNFPVLREEARKEAELNVKKFLVELESKITDEVKNIAFEKFADPDVQATINDAVQSSARKGENSNYDILVDLIVERASKSSDNFKNIVISEAVNLVPKITKEQIAYLSFVHYMTNMGSNIKNISDLENRSKVVLEIVSSSFRLSNFQKKHLIYAGVYSHDLIIGKSIYDGWMNYLYKSLEYTNINKFKNDIEKYSPSSKILLDTFDKESKMENIRLTSVGAAIAIADLSKVIDGMKYSLWLK